MVKFFSTNATFFQASSQQNIYLQKSSFSKVALHNRRLSFHDHHTLVPSTLVPGCHASVHPKKKYVVLFKIGILFSLDTVNYDKSIVLLPEAIVRMVLQLPSREHEAYNGKEIKVSLV